MNILIIDDEPLVTSHIADLVAEKYSDSLILAYTSAEAFLAEREGLPFIDVAFLDIRIPGINGINLGTFLLTQQPATKIIFISGYPDCVSEIFFNIQPYGFIDKPIVPEKVYRYIDRILKDENEEIAISFRDKNLRIKTNNILWVESNRKTIEIMTTDGKRTMTGKLRDIESFLPGYFARCHQSFVVNLKYTTGCNFKVFTMISGEEIPISRSFKEKAVNKYYSFRGNIL